MIQALVLHKLALLRSLHCLGCFELAIIVENKHVKTAAEVPLFLFGLRGR